MADARKVRMGLLAAAAASFIFLGFAAWVWPALRAGGQVSWGPLLAALLFGLALALAGLAAVRTKRWVALTILAPIWLIVFTMFVPGGIVVWVPLVLVTAAALIPVTNPPLAAATARLRERGEGDG